MSKSLNRVKAALKAAGVASDVVEMDAQTRTAQQAADAIGCAPDQIAKCVVLHDSGADALVLFITAGGRAVKMAKAEALVGASLARADAARVRDITGFAIGGVSPVGHLTPIRTFFDRNLSRFPLVWAAAGTPHHVFSIAPADLIRVTGAQASDFTT
ncbi:YbaK/EbsC family protein [Oceaniglobus indicus]|uniref:YbaK/EbsC family protein n=1 Tax=Oceaniglobus indicus TaxID=2047749 RepID=UPI000C17DC7A|nr:YbaK/EbsC family protein [Oceaniglobus indicus]